MIIALLGEVHLAHIFENQITDIIVPTLHFDHNMTCGITLELGDNKKYKHLGAGLTDFGPLSIKN